MYSSTAAGIKFDIFREVQADRGVSLNTCLPRYGCAGYERGRLSVVQADTGIEVNQAEFSISESDGFDVGELFNAIGRTVAVIGEVVQIIAIRGGAFSDGVIGGITRQLGNVLARTAV